MEWKYGAQWFQLQEVCEVWAYGLEMEAWHQHVRGVKKLKCPNPVLVGYKSKR